ncbi:MAG: hypothetical protein LBD75_01020 [Candidatus Peribacteria bacterium]|nr:hypothetical protein [Candidatus Peribacteria bacterium]
MHFEIDKDVGGRPAYVYTNCAEVNQGHYEIIQKGYCRIQLFQYTKDPIVLLEGANATHPSLNEPSLPSLPEEKADTPDDSHLSPSLPEVAQPTQPQEPTQPTQPTSPETSTPSLISPNVQVNLDFSKVDLVGKTFLNTRDISLEKSFGEEVTMNNELVITVHIKHKITGEAFHGTLSQPLLLIANNTNVNIVPVSTVVISRGEAKITIEPKAKGNTYIAINL